MTVAAISSPASVTCSWYPPRAERPARSAPAISTIANPNGTATANGFTFLAIEMRIGSTTTEILRSTALMSIRVQLRQSPAPAGRMSSRAWRPAGGGWPGWVSVTGGRPIKRPDCGLPALTAQGCGNCWLISIAVSTPWHGPPTARACSYSTMTGDEPGLPTSAWPMKCGWWPQTWAAPALADPMAAALSPSLTMTAWPTPIPARNFPLK